MILLTADLHLTEKPDDEYRWHSLDFILEQVSASAIDAVYILGDMFDRKDRFPSHMVNRLVGKLGEISKLSPVTILMGNHDKPVEAIYPYASWFNALAHRVRYIIEPTIEQDLALLPFNSDPAQAWQNIDFGRVRAAFCHQCFDKALGSNGPLEGVKFSFPKHLKVYSGDIHIPQKLGQIIYVGAPHPVTFGDQHDTRMLLLNQRYDIAEELHVPSIRKRKLIVQNVSELASLKVSKGDHVQVEVHIKSSSMSQWSVDLHAVNDWASKHGVKLVSAMPIVDLEAGKTETSNNEVEWGDPENVLLAYCHAEKIPEPLMQKGLELLNGKGI